MHIQQQVRGARLAVHMHQMRRLLCVPRPAHPVNFPAPYCCNTIPLSARDGITLPKHWFCLQKDPGRYFRSAKSISCIASHSASHLPLPGCPRSVNRGRRRAERAPCAAYSGTGGKEPDDRSMPPNQASSGFGSLERYVADRAQDSEGGSRGDWLQVCPPPGIWSDRCMYPLL